MRVCIQVAVAWCLVVATFASGQSEGKVEARAIVERAIKASGGESNLAKRKASVTKIKGSIQQASDPVPVTAEISSQRPNQERVEYKFTAGTERGTMIIVLNGNKGWIKMGEDTQEMDEKELKEARESAYANWLTFLLPLLDKEITLASLGERKVEGRVTVGVKASRKDRRDVSLFFEKDSGLLALVETRVVDDDTDQEVTETTHYRDYKEVDGLQQATKFSIKRDGKPYFEGTVSGIKLLDRLDDSVFAKP